MNINLDNTLKSIENLNVQSFEDQLDFLGTYSGLTAYKFSRYIEDIFNYIKNIMAEEASLIAHKIDIKELKEHEQCYVFCLDELPLLCLVFEINAGFVVNIKNGSHFVSAYTDNYDHISSCIEFRIYEDDKDSYIPNAKDALVRTVIQEALAELLSNNEYGVISFQDCQLWYYKYNYLANHYADDKVYRYKEEITFVLDYVRKFINSELHTINHKIKIKIASCFDLSNVRESAIYQNIAEMSFYKFDPYIYYYLGLSEPSIPEVRLLPESEDLYLGKLII